MTGKFPRGHRGANGRPAGGGRRFVLLTVASVGVEAICLWLRAGRIGGRVVVRCRDGHLFTTVWIPGGSVKALRLGWVRFQRCPVGGHWSVITPIRESSLSEADRQLARERRDTPIP
jgi:hypothetical protein